MTCVSVELSPRTPSVERQPAKAQFHPCSECGAPMLLMAATEALHHPITLRKTYQCVVCQSVEVMVAPLFET
jgi:hypothetical protein